MTNEDSHTAPVVTPNRHERFIEGLRSLADHLESHPDFPQLSWTPDFYFRVGTKEELVAVARTLGSFTKRTSGGNFYLDKGFGKDVVAKIYTSRENVCTKVVTGQAWEEGRTAQEATEGKMVDVVRWDCPDMFLTKEDA